jgi:AcrR family transcriptional regulator
VPAVAEHAKVGAGTIYRYFENKEALVNALYQRWKGEISRRVLADFPVTAAAREQFHTFWTRLAAFVDQHPKAFAFLELHHHRSYLDDRSRAIESQLIGFAVSFIANAQSQGQLVPGPPLLLMSLVYGAFTGLVRAHWEHDLQLTPENLALAEDRCWHAIATGDTL